MTTSNMTIEEIDKTIEKLQAEIRALYYEKEILKRKRFDVLANRVYSALHELKQEFPYAEWTVEIDEDECVDLLSRSDILKENSLSPN